MKTPRPHTTHHTTIPAEPGWMHCTPIHGDDGAVVDFYEAPVLAWVVTIETDGIYGDLMSREAQAVVADYTIRIQHAQYLKRPDGLYISRDHGWYKTRKDVIASMQEDSPWEARIAEIIAIRRTS